MIRYSCGSARMFKQPNKGYIPSQTIMCQWNGIWTPTLVLLVSSFMYINKEKLNLLEFSVLPARR